MILLALEYFRFRISSSFDSDLSNETLDLQSLCFLMPDFAIEAMDL